MKASCPPVISLRCPLQPADFDDLFVAAYYTVTNIRSRRIECR